jgi:uncharacterized protein (TIGR02594 family)
MISLQAAVGRAGPNHARDVETVQHLLNTKFSGIGPVRRLKANGKCGPDTIQAIEDFERLVFPSTTPTGTLLPHSAVLQTLVAQLGAIPHGVFPAPAWLKTACDEEAKGVRERRGFAQNNPDVLKYLAAVPGLAKIPESKGSSIMMSQVDETAWCACFVKWCLQQAGFGSTPGAGAITWHNYGQPTQPRPGAITVLYRKLNDDSASGWHVGFWIGGTSVAPVLLGGNQSNSVCRKAYCDLEKIYYRWPA